MPCTQLEYCTRLDATMWSSGRSNHSRAGRGGGSSFGPMYVQIIPARSATGYDAVRTFHWKLLSGGSLGMSTHLPATSNFQPW